MYHMFVRPQAANFRTPKLLTSDHPQGNKAWAGNAGSRQGQISRSAKERNERFPGQKKGLEKARKQGRIRGIFRCDSDREIFFSLLARKEETEIFLASSEVGDMPWTYRAPSGLLCDGSNESGWEHGIYLAARPAGWAASRERLRACACWSPRWGMRWAPMPLIALSLAALPLCSIVPCPGNRFRKQGQQRCFSLWSDRNMTPLHIFHVDGGSRPR